MCNCWKFSHDWLLINRLKIYHTENVTVSCTKANLYLSLEGADDEREGVRVDALDALLHHVVAVLVLDALEHVAVEFGDDLVLLLRRDGLERLLDHAAAVHLQRQRQHVAAQLLRQRLLLFGRSELKELLDHVVAEHVRHQRVCVHQDLGEHCLLVGDRRTLQLLLDEAAAVLVLRSKYTRFEYFFFGISSAGYFAMMFFFCVLRVNLSSRYIYDRDN
jgi:hypothetical protein